MKYREAYDYGVALLKEQGISEADLDARLLLEFVCQTNRNDLLVHAERQLSTQQEKTYVNHINDRAKHIPLQYITHVQEFMGLEFYVNQSVLIPRQDTEHLTEEVMKYLHDGMNILDMCTGSGCILLSLLKYSNGCRGLGADYSRAALEVAEKNADKLGIQADFLWSNLFEQVTGKFDIIVSNPPYIRSDVIPALMPEVREHEPIAALDGKEDGLFFYREIVMTGRKYLYRGGRLFLEIGYDQGEAVKDMLVAAGYKQVCIQKDFAGLNRVVHGIFTE